ncbi:MAG TPA: VWA domain-containing protein [Candidatus Kapabacteria bacterium]|nr:VWA domain-containing protein [Candidatus Kapabacteria bacterium]
MSEVDASKFPIVSANFSAFDFSQKQYQNLTSNDFTVVDNGIKLPASLVSLECTKDAPYNIVIVIDKSSSMKEEVDGQVKWDWAKEGVETFMNNIPIGDSSRMALTLFSGNASIACNFTKYKKEILDSLNKLQGSDIYGSTNFNVAFLDNFAGAINLLKKQNPNYKRAIIFLSDGEHENSNGPFQLNTVSNLLREFNIQLFAITLLSTKSNDLDLLAQRTGGYYDFVSSKSQLNGLYTNFANQLQLRQICKLVWQNPDVCGEHSLYRSASIRFNILGITVNKTYTAPQTSIVYIESDQSLYDFGNPDIGKYEEREIVVTPRIKNFTAKNIKIVPKDYFEIIDWGDGIGNQPNYDFIMPVNVPRKIKVRFTPQIVKKYRKAALILEGEPCPKEIQLVGGYHRVTITKPTQGEFLSQCDSVNIVWQGNESDALLDLSYSSDNGTTWKSIIKKYQGYSYKWKSPVVGNNIKVKVESTPGYEYDFANSYGGTNDDITTSLCVTENGLYHYVTGYFSGEFTIGSTKLVSKGKEDIFLAKFDNEGNLIWAQSAGSMEFDDRAYGVVTDYDGNVYLTGVTYDGVQFDNFSPALEVQKIPYLFVTKFNAYGKYLNSRFLGATPEYKNLQMAGYKIGFEYKLGELPKIMVEGTYKGEYMDYNLNVYLPLSLIDTVFSFAMTPDLEITEMYAAAKNWTYTTKEANYISEAFYETDNFSGSLKIDRFNLNSKGKNDFWISKYSKIAQSVDISAAFSIVKQEPKFINNIYVFGDVVYGDSVAHTLTKTIYNPFAVPVEITGYKFGAIADSDVKNDYTLLTDIIGKKINPNDSIDLQIAFKPNYTGPRNAWLDISSSCGSDIRLEIKGNGVCGGTSLPIYDFGDQNLKKAKKDTIKCAFKNISNVKLVVSPLVRGTNFSDYTLEIPDYYTVYNGKITVNPNECLDIIVTFNPKELGAREAYINFNVENPCKNSMMDLAGVGISSDISITSYDWSERRVKGNYPAQIQIKNNSEGIERIDSIKFADANYSKYFDLKINPNDYPINIDANSIINIDVQYNPILEQIDSADIYCYIASRAEPLVAKLNGIGILPKLITNWTCGKEINIGDSTIATLTLENPSKSSILQINEIKFENIIEEFTFINPNDVLARTLNKEEKITIPVMFKPKANSPNTNNIFIYADDYDGQFKEQWKLTKVNTSCDGLQIEFNNIDFGNVILCSNNATNIILKNNSKSKDVTLYLDNAIFSQNSDIFKLNIAGNLQLNAGAEIILPISMLASKLETFTSVLSIPNSANYAIEINISGSSKNYVPSTTLKSAEYSVADIFSYPIDLDIPQLKSGEINNVKLILNYDPYVIKYMDNSIKSSLANWMWTTNYLSNGNLEINGSGKINDNQKIQSFSLDFMVLLNDKHKTDITVKADYDCQIFDYDLSVITSSKLCFNDNRIIVKNGQANFALKDISPNPIVENTNIEFGLGFEVDVQIDIFNSNGEKIESLVNNTLPSGYYETLLDTRNLSNGIYFVKMVAGPFKETKKIIILK